MARKETYSNSDLIDIIDTEGLGYAVQYYLGSESIEDPIVAALWKKAFDALEAIEAELGIDY